MDKQTDRDHYSILSEGVRIKGSMVVPHGIRIDGDVKGTIEAGGVLTIGIKGTIDAEISAKSVIIGGVVVGNVKAQESVKLEAPATYTGNIEARDITIHEGAKFNGRCSTQDKKDS